MAGISSKGIYGLAAMHVLSHAVNGRTMQVKEISAMTKISHAYLEQLLSTLRKSSLVESVRGVGGGFKLARPAHDITVLEIMLSLEGEIFKVGSNVGDSLILEYFWEDIQTKVQKLYSLKLSELDQAYQPYHFDI